MELRVRYAGVPIGTITLDALTGLPHGALSPGVGYDLVRARIEHSGREVGPKGFGARMYWPSARGDFAEVASAIAGGYELEDLRGMRVSAASVVVFATPGHEMQPEVVVDFRPHTAQVFAALPDGDTSNGGRRRPAA
jgi:hypothetical protein